MYYKSKTIVKQSLPVLVVCATISMLAGFVLNTNNDILFSIPGILVVIPSYINMNGSIVSILSCRISSALHMGTIKPKFRRTKTLNKNLMITFFDSIVSFIMLGIIANLFNTIIGVASLDIFVFPVIILVAGLLTIGILSVLSIIFSYVSFSRGIDPDNLTIPVLTSIGDVVGVFLLFMVLGLFV